MNLALRGIDGQIAHGDTFHRGTLDNKIELNRRMNETLEAMAWAIFKSWFVDFDPVRQGQRPRPRSRKREERRGGANAW